MLPQILLVVAAGCALGRGQQAQATEAGFPVAVESAPAVAAEYRSERTGGGQQPAVQGSWRLWRETDRVHREYPASRLAEQWQRDGGTIFHTRYFLAEGRGVGFESADLEMAGVVRDWSQIALLVSPQLLQELQVVGKGSRDGYDWQRYQGTSHGVQWDITVRLDLMLPTDVERVAGSERERLQLVGAWPLAQAPWQPTPTASFPVMDFADLGDNERDPFVMRIQGQLGVGHVHGHEH